jgi:hypothetical protein
MTPASSRSGMLVRWRAPCAESAAEGDRMNDDDTEFSTGKVAVHKAKGLV